ncbi:MAG: hypothetical protein MRJ65_04960 [Candidatus Brocadiaceae bacterium]|nr:hypothetical protein [Candidatus Brocadiaceae bacterium]
MTRFFYPHNASHGKPGVSFDCKITRFTHKQSNLSIHVFKDCRGYSAAMIAMSLAAERTTSEALSKKFV